MKVFSSLMAFLILLCCQVQGFAIGNLRIFIIPDIDLTYIVKDQRLSDSEAVIIPRTPDTQTITVLCQDSQAQFSYTIKPPKDTSLERNITLTFFPNSYSNPEFLMYLEGDATGVQHLLPDKT